MVAAFSFLEIASAQFFNDYSEEPHRYWDAELKDPMSALVRDLSSGRRRFAESEKEGRALVERLLKELNIPASSQVLVFSKTSLQKRAVHPGNPRAIYFNDDVYLGWMPGGRVEIGSVDPELGSVFYFQRDFDEDPEKPLFHRDRVCIQCHAGSPTNFLPGPMGMSVFPNELGRAVRSVDSFELSGHEIPFHDRWGGWYVSGKQGAMRHMGNTLAERTAGEVTIDREKHVNLVGFADFFPEEKYPAKGSDLLALLILDHQIGMHYRLMEAHYRVRQALWDKENTPEGEEPRSDYETELSESADTVLRYLFFCDEAALGAETVAGDSTYRDTFLAAKVPTKDGRSLRDLRLQERIFEYRCSYMIYNAAFTALPGVLKQAIFSRMRTVLKSDSSVEGFEHLGTGEKRAILEILTETLPGFAS